MDTQPHFSSPPKVIQRNRGHGQTRFEKETAANGGKVDTYGDPPNLGPWVLGDTIGKGSSGRVRLARHNQSGKLAAVKIIPKNIMFSSRMSISNAGAKHEKLMLGIRREIVIMKLIDHPNIMALYDVFEADNELYLLLEYIEGGELFDFLVSKGRLSPPEALKYFREVIYGIDYCHRFNICHRDLKPENLLLDSNRNIKIADFGMAAMEIANGMLETSCGSPHYASPEIVAGKAYHGAASDIWSCGVVLFALLVGRLPFDDPNMRVLLGKVRAGKFDMPAYIPPDARDLIRRMLVVDPEARIQMSDIKKHPFFCNPAVPRPLQTPDSPSVEDIARTIPSEKDIDRACVQNLMILWQGSSERKIIDALTCAEVTWQKAYYFLLSKYQQKSLEEYGEGYSFGFETGRWHPPAYLIKQRLAKAEEDAVRRKDWEREREVVRRGRERTAPEAQGHPSPVRRHGHTTTRTAPFPVSPERGAGLPVATRDAPPTPSPTKRPQGSQVRPRPQSVIGGPRPLSSGGPPSKIAGVVSPNTEERDRRRMPPPPSPITRRSTAPVESPRASRTMDAERVASSSAAREIDSTSAEIVRARFGFGNPERAEAFASTPNAAPSRNRETSSNITFPSPKGLGLAFPPGEAPASPRSSRASTIQSPDQMPISPPVVENAAVQKFFNEVAGALNNLQAPLPGSAPATPTTPAFLVNSQAASPAQPSNNYPPQDGLSTPSRNPNVNISRRASNKENARTPSKVNSTIDGYVMVKDLEAQTPGGAGRKHRPAPLELSTHNRASTFGPQPSPIPSPLLTGSDFAKGNGWFSSLFNFKPATYTLISQASVVTTRREVARLLELFGVSVALEEGGDGHGVLKCYAERIYDVTGGFRAKSVRFRVVFQNGTGKAGGGYSMPNTPGVPGYSPMQSPMLSPPVSTGFGIGCSFTLVQERGARSTLEAVAQRLRHEWNLDSLSSAQPSPVLDSAVEFSA